MTLAQLMAEHFAKLKPGAKIVYLGWTGVWVCEKVVERGAILYKAEDGSHKHLAEWHELAAATIND